MASEKQQSPERDPFMAAVEAKIAAWKAVLESYRAAKALDGGLGDLPSASGAGSFGGRAMDLPVGVFRDKSIKEAIVIFLEAMRRKQTNKEIAIGLQKGGIATTSANFEATVGTALLRLKNEGVVLRFPDGWDLAASYPDSLRTRLEKDTKPAKKTASKGKARSQKRKAEARARPKPRAAKPLVARDGLEQRVTEYLKTRGTEFTTAQELVTQLHVPHAQVLHLTLGRMTKHGRLEKNENGLVRLVREAA